MDLPLLVDLCVEYQVYFSNVDTSPQLPLPVNTGPLSLSLACPIGTSDPVQTADSCPWPASHQSPASHTRLPPALGLTSVNVPVNVPVSSLRSRDPCSLNCLFQSSSELCRFYPCTKTSLSFLSDSSHTFLKGLPHSASPLSNSQILPSASSKIQLPSPPVPLLLWCPTTFRIKSKFLTKMNQDPSWLLCALCSGLISQSPAQNLPSSSPTGKWTGL